MLHLQNQSIIFVHFFFLIYGQHRLFEDFSPLGELRVQYSFQFFHRNLSLVSSTSFLQNLPCLFYKILIYSIDDFYALLIIKTVNFINKEKKNLIYYLITQYQSKMINKCKIHNLEQDMVCMGQTCPKRIGCQLCIRKHDHKFYLDTKSKQSKVTKVQKQLDEKLVHLKKYINSNITSLKLEKYKQTVEQTFTNELFYIKTKIEEEKQNFKIWIEKTETNLINTIQNLQKQIIQNWNIYNQKSVQYLKGEEQYEELRQYFKNGNWGQHDHVETGVNFLYSEEVLFKFNKNMDNLKKIIHFNKKQNNYIFTWIYNLRQKFSEYELCPINTFQKFNDQYDNKPNMSTITFQATKQTRQNQQSILKTIKQDKKALLLYPKQIYEPYQFVYKLTRLNNLLFATTGARSLNIWTKVQLQPEQVYEVDYTTYGLSTFYEKGQDDTDVLLFGKSNGQIGQLDMRIQKIKYIKAHEMAVRDILQFDDYHFITASQDWLLKVWAMNDKDETKFASQRGVLKGHSGKLHCMCKFGPNLLAAGADGTVKLWDIQSESYDEVFEHQKQIYTLTQIRPQLFLSGGQLNQLRLFDYRIPKTPAVRYPIQYCCNSSLRYNQNSFLMADRHIVKLVDIRKYNQPQVRYENKQAYSHAINSMDFLSDMEIGMGGSDNFITIWKY